MQSFIPTIYFTGHVGRFSVYPSAAYAITIATSRDKLSMPKWRNNIPVQVPVSPDDSRHRRAPHHRFAQHGRTTLVRRSRDLQGMAMKLAEALACRPQENRPFSS